MARPSSREKILAATEALVTRVGAVHLTLDAVAEEAAMSKGGLLYHFKTKRELLQALVVEHLNDKLEALAEQRALLRGANASALETHLKVNLCAEDASSRKMGVALLAAIANDPTLLVPIEERFDDILSEVWGTDEAFNPDAALLWLAVEGLRFFNLMGIQPLTPEQREKVTARVLQLASDLGEGGSLHATNKPAPGEKQPGAKEPAAEKE
ncbi:MAG: hypothetical protein PWP23_1894 [Candidatus Sumerlaeota bacterium]|nr:hypothetical protein [Candidatus Sumerlaeota bacterium]